MTSKPHIVCGPKPIAYVVRVWLSDAAGCWLSGLASNGGVRKGDSACEVGMMSRKKED
jgi:hypothetical protein